MSKSGILGGLMRNAATGFNGRCEWHPFLSGYMRWKFSGFTVVPCVLYKCSYSQGSRTYSIAICIFSVDEKITFPNKCFLLNLPLLLSHRWSLQRDRIIISGFFRFDLPYRYIVSSVEKRPVIGPKRRCGNALFVVKQVSVGRIHGPGVANCHRSRNTFR